LSGVIRFIRFPLFSVQEFATNVQSANILSSEQMLGLFTYIASKESKSKNLPKVDFPTEKRGNAKSAFVFKWARCGSYGSLSNDNTKLTSSSGSYCVAIADKGIEPNSGQYYWEIRCDSVSSSWYTGIGVCTQSVNVNDYMTTSSYGWAYMNHGVRAHASGSDSDKYGGSYTTNDVIGVGFDSDKGTLTMFKKGDC